MDLVNPVRDFIIENFLFGDSENFAEDTSFLDSGIIDSTGILELVAFLEETYGIAVEDDELVPENFNSLGEIATFLGRKLNGE